MSKDISPALEGWEWEGPERLTVRKIVGRDGKEKIQMRLELGVLQMEADGRPDGTRPYGFESLLDYYLAKLEKHRKRTGSDEGFALSHDDCIELHRESLQYYHRRISCLALGDYDRAERDAKHNLQIMDLLKDYAEHREDWLAIEQWRAYVLMHRTQARALRCLERRDLDGALRHVNHGITVIKDLFESYGKPEMAGESIELWALNELRQDIVSRKPPTLKERLRRELDEAVAREDYKRAAELKRRLQELEG